MLECPYCYRVFREPPEKIGARCPKCRMPLFEGASKRRRPDKDLGPCATHPDSAAIANCHRCNAAVCGVCRTRWHDEPCCPACVEQSVAADEPGPHEEKRQFRHAAVSLGAAAAGWLLVLLMLWPLSTFHDGAPPRVAVKVAGALFCLSFLPAIIGLGQGLAALRLRGESARLATWGLTGAGSQLGLLLGIILFNLWHN